MTSWTPSERATAIGRALAVGSKKASAETGIPRRTISSWLAGERPAPELEVIRADSRSDVANAMWSVVSEGTAEALRRIHDPKTRVGELAQIIKVVGEQHALLTGGATSRSENFNVNAEAMPPSLTWEEERDLANWLDAQLDEARDPGDIAAVLRDGVRAMEGTAADLTIGIKSEVKEAVASLETDEQDSLRDYLRDLARQRLQR